MIKQIAHVCIGSEDLEATRHFYCNVLGMTKTFDFIKNGQLYGYYLSAGENTFIEVFTQEEAANRERPLIRHLCLEVDDIDQLIETVRVHGIEATDKKLGSDQSWQCWVNDPDGVAIEFHHYTADSSQFTGTSAEVTW